MNAQNWILIDSENLGMLDLQPLAKLEVNVVLFAGHQQKSVPFDLFKQGVEMKAKLSVVKSPTGGKNALDFQMAFWAGRIAERDPKANFHFVTKDTGFDALVAQMNQSGLSASRVPALSALPCLPGKTAKGFSFLEIVAQASDFLNKQPANSRPRKRKTLLSSLTAYLSKKLPAEKVEKVVTELVAQGKVSIGDKETISYSL
jgi:hypothetical protein